MAKARGSASNILTAVRLTQMVKEIESGVARGPCKKTYAGREASEDQETLQGLT